MLDCYRRCLAVVVAVILVLGCSGSIALTYSADDTRGMLNAGPMQWLQAAGTLQDFTINHVGEYVALLDDGKLLKVPTIRDMIPSGRAQISGFALLPEAKKTSDVLCAGEAPVVFGVIMTRD